MLDELLAACLTPSMERPRVDRFAAGWIMTLFSSHDALPQKSVRRVWDLFLVDGWKAVFRVILAILDVLTEVGTTSAEATCPGSHHLMPPPPACRDRTT